MNITDTLTSWRMQGTQSPAVRRTAAGAVLLALAVASWTFVVAPRADGLDQARAEAEQARAANEATQDRIAKLRAYAGDMQSLDAEAQEVADLFPNSTALPDLLRELRAAGKAAGITDLDIDSMALGRPVLGTAVSADGSAVQEPGDAKEPGIGSLGSQTLSISAAANAKQATAFVEELQSMSRAFLVDSVSFQAEGTLLDVEEAQTSGDVEDPSRVTVSGRLFLLPAPPAPGEGAETS